MDKRYWNRGGEVVEPGSHKFFNKSIPQQRAEIIASLPAIGSIDPSYPVGWVGDDVEMVWQVRIRKSMEWFNTEKEIYDKWLTDGAKEDLRRILFLPVNKVTIKSESHVDLSGVEFVQPVNDPKYISPDPTDYAKISASKNPYTPKELRGQPDYTKEAEERIYPTYEQSGGGKNWDEMTELEQAYYNLRKAYNAFDVMKNTYLRVRQQSAAEIDRLRGLIKVAHDTGYFNGASYIEESKWEESWQQFKTENNIQ